MQQNVLSRGERNNNPGNIKKNNGKPYVGEVIPSKDPTFKQFATRMHGFMAIITTLKTYFYKWALKTVEGIISRWAPANENRTAAYIAFVCGKLGVKPTDVLTFCFKTIALIVLAIAHYESGYEREEWKGEIREAWLKKFGNHFKM